MPSANGWILEVSYSHPERGRVTESLTASWPAPFFVLIECDDAPPLLVHCEDRAHADRVVSVCDRTRLLDHNFDEIRP